MRSGPPGGFLRHLGPFWCLWEPFSSRKQCKNTGFWLQPLKNHCENTWFWFSGSHYDCKNTGFCIGSLPEPCFFACFLVAKMRPGWSPHLCNKKALKNTGFWQHPDAEPCVFTVILARRKPEPCVFTVISCHLMTI